MRKIKFRGQRQSDSKWIYGDLLQPTELCDIYEISDLLGIKSVPDTTKLSEELKKLEDEVVVYNIVTGKGGKGGAYASTGTNGGNSGILIGDNAIIYAQSGAAGGHALNNGATSGGRRCGIGGKLQSDSELGVYNFTKLSDSRNGNNGGTGSCGGSYGRSVYPVGTYGQGGPSNGWREGKPGTDGLGKVIFKTCSNYDDYSRPPSTEMTEIISRELS